MLHDQVKGPLVGVVEVVVPSADPQDLHVGADHYVARSWRVGLVVAEDLPNVLVDAGCDREVWFIQVLPVLQCIARIGSVTRCGMIER